MHRVSLSLSLFLSRRLLLIILVLFSAIEIYTQTLPSYLHRRRRLSTTSPRIAFRVVTFKNDVV